MCQLDLTESAFTSFRIVEINVKSYFLFKLCNSIKYLWILLNVFIGSIKEVNVEQSSLHSHLPGDINITYPSA